MSDPTPADAPVTDAPAPEPEQPPSRLATWAKVFGLTSDLITPSNVVVAILALTLLVVGVFGGWGAAAEADATEAEVPVKAAGERVEAKPFELTLHKAIATEEVAGRLPKTPGSRYLIVSADLTDRDSRYVEDDAGITGNLVRQDALSIDAAGLVRYGKPLPEGQAQAPSVYRVNDTQGQQAFQPGVLTPVIVVWEQASSEPAPEHLTVTVNSYTWRRSSLDGHLFWTDPTPAARITLPVVTK